MIYIKDNIDITNTGFTLHYTDADGNPTFTTYTAGTLKHLTDEQLAEFGITKQEPEPAPEPEPQPTVYVTTPAKLRLVLLGAGLLDTVEAAVQQADRETQIMWEFSLEYFSDHPKLVAMAAALGINQEQMDALFMQAQEV